MIEVESISTPRSGVPTHAEIRAVLNDLRTPIKFDGLVCEASYRAGTFDSHFVDAPYVFRHDGRFYLTYVGWDSRGYQTGMASSDDLINWQKEGLLIGRGEAGSVTEHNVALTCILRDNQLFGSGEVRRVGGKFLGTYHAYPAEGLEAGAAVIGLCTSDDLRTWTIHEPVLRPEDGAAWERGGLYKSWIMEHDGVYYLYYNAKNKLEWPWREQTGVATSRDLIDWTRHDANPVVPFGPDGAFDDLFASDPCVLRHRGLWLMFYFGNCSDGHSRDGVAVSRDLLNWVKSDEILVDIGQGGSFDSVHAAKPAMIAWQGQLHHFYCAVARCNEGQRLGEIEYHERRGIGVAWSDVRGRAVRSPVHRQIKTGQQSGA